MDAMDQRIGGPLAPLPSFGAALRVWLRIGLLSFGGPAGQIAMLHREIVEERRWLGERRFLHALSFCALLPGPEAQQLATYLGWVMHGPLGGVAAGTLFVLPGAVVLLGLSVLYASLGQVPAVDGLFFGLQCAVLAIVVQAVLRVGGRSLRNRATMAVAVTAFLALAVFAAPFSAVVAAAALVGALRPRWFRAGAAHGTGDGPPGLIEQHMVADPARMARQGRAARRAGAAALLLWLAPVGALRLWWPGRFADLALFYSKMAVVTVGGAYAVLAYVAQDAVHRFHWVTPSEMLAGLGLAETTPGPLILVLQFVAFMAAAERHCRRCGGERPGAVGDVHAVLRVRAARRAGGGAARGKPAPGRGAGGGDCLRRRCDCEPGAVVRAARVVCRDVNVAWRGAAAAGKRAVAGAGVGGAGGGAALGRAALGAAHAGGLCCCRYVVQHPGAIWGVVAVDIGPVAPHHEIRRAHI
jgi:chromate transporter